MGGTCTPNGSENEKHSYKYINNFVPSMFRDVDQSGYCSWSNFVKGVEDYNPLISDDTVHMVTRKFQKTDKKPNLRCPFLHKLLNLLETDNPTKPTPLSII